MPPRHALLALVVLGTLLRLALAASLGPSNDEAYYSLFAVHPDWSYFDHPPLVGVLIWVGRTIASGHISVLALRAAFIGLFAGSTWLMARLAGRLYGPKAGLLAALALNVTGYYGIVAGSCALPDGPLVFFWLLTLERLAAALESPRAVGLWVAVGLAWGGALLSKYHAVFLPAGFLLWACLDHDARRFLKQPGPYIAFGMGVLAFSPVLWWNAHHGWVSFLFQGRRALGPVGLRLDLLAAALVGQAGYLFPWMWLMVLVAGFKCARGFFRETSQAERLLLCQAFWPLTVFFAVACQRPVLPHWSLVAFLGLFPLVGRTWAERLAANPVRQRRRLVLVTALPVALAAFLAIQGRTGVCEKNGLIAGPADPTVDLFGWDQVAKALADRGVLGQPGIFLFTSTWYQSAQLAFAVDHRIPVACYHPHDSRGFALWSHPDDWVGRDGILVAIDNRSIEPGCFDRWFARIAPLGQFPIVRGGLPVHTVRLFRCERQLQPFPFDASSPPASLPQMVARRWFGVGKRR
jgi:4-amino-4-deoxy-L-arabinose transferase-like glycosyltransferase